MKDKTKPEQRSRNNNNKGSGMKNKNACVFPCESRWVAPAVNPLSQCGTSSLSFSLALYFLLTTYSALAI